jgi:hypothetical protein
VFIGCSFQLPFRFKNRAFKSQDDVRSPNINVKSNDQNSRQKYNSFNVVNHRPAPQSDWFGGPSVFNVVHANSLIGWRPCKNRPQHLAQIQRFGFI